MTLIRGPRSMLVAVVLALSIAALLAIAVWIGLALLRPEYPAVLRPWWR